MALAVGAREHALVSVAASGAAAGSRPVGRLVPANYSRHSSARGALAAEKSRCFPESARLAHSVKPKIQARLAPGRYHPMRLRLGRRRAALRRDRIPGWL